MKRLTYKILSETSLMTLRPTGETSLALDTDNTIIIHLSIYPSTKVFFLSTTATPVQMRIPLTEPIYISNTSLFFHQCPNI